MKIFTIILIVFMSLPLQAEDVNFHCLYLGEKEGDNLFCFVPPVPPQLEDLDPITRQFIKQNPDSKGVFLKMPKNTPFEQKERELIHKNIKFQKFEVLCPDSENSDKCQSHDAPKEFPAVNFSTMMNIAMASIGSLNPDFALLENDNDDDNENDTTAKEVDLHHCIMGGWSGKWNGEKCQVNAPVCSSGKVACNPLFYGDDVCLPVNLLGHVGCSKTHTPGPISKQIFTNNKMEQFDDQFGDLQAICMTVSINEETQSECENFTNWGDLVGEELNKLEGLSQPSDFVALQIGEVENSHQDIIAQKDSTISNRDIAPDSIETKKTSFTLKNNRVVSLVGKPTKKKIPGYENENHFIVNIREGENEYQYLMPESDFIILVKGSPVDMTFGDKITFDDGIFPMELESQKIDPLKKYLSQCLTIIELFFQQKIDLKDEKWQRFLKLQADLTLHRLGWAYLKIDNKQALLEDKIISLLKQKFAKENDEARVEFDALLTFNKKSRTFLPMALNLVSDVLYKQADGQKIKKERPFLLSSSDITMLEILADNEQKMIRGGRDHRFFENHKEQQSVLNFTTLVNSAYVHSESRINNIQSKRKNLDHIEKHLSSISNTFREDLREIVGKECVDDLELVCGLEQSRESILNEFMMNFSLINTRAIEGLLQRSDSQNYLKYGDLWLKTAN